MALDTQASPVIAAAAVELANADATAVELASADATAVELANADAAPTNYCQPSPVLAASDVELADGGDENFDDIELPPLPKPDLGRMRSELACGAKAIILLILISLGFLPVPARALPRRASAERTHCSAGD